MSTPDPVGDVSRDDLALLRWLEAEAQWIVSSGASTEHNSLPFPNVGEWLVRLICCGRDDGSQVVRTWDEANAFREAYTSGVGVKGPDWPWAGGHERSAIVSRLLSPQPLGWREPR